MEAKNDKFINPYNFVEVDFSKEPERGETPCYRNGKSGVLRCRLITKSPIAIPDTNDDNYNYFMRDESGRAFIPASSIRGPIRSMYETLTNSCFSTVNEQEIITYRTRKPFTPGLLYVDENNKYHLFFAKRYIFKVDGKTYAKYEKELGVKSIKYTDLKNYHYGEKVFITPIKNEKNTEKTFCTSSNFKTNSIFIKELSKEPTKKAIEGFVCIGEPFGKKHFESVFVKDEEEKVNSMMLERTVGSLNKIIKIYRENNNRCYVSRNYECIEKEKYYPIWYKIFQNNRDITNIHLSVANIGRAAYSNNMGDMLKGYKSCKSRKNACEACRLFGLVNSNGNLSASSRVRFSDAVTDMVVEKKEKSILKELSSPKPSYMPFYLKGNNNFDEWSYDNEKMTIKGRKFYWHMNPKNSQNNEWRDPNNTLSDRNDAMELLDKDNVFRFSVYFNNLSDSEIEKLIWTLCLGENKENGKFCHKLGHGKPIGLGSVKIVVDDLEEREFNGSYTITKKKNVEPQKDLFHKSIVSQIKTVTDLFACNYVVDYPGVINSKGEKYYDANNKHAAHQWFSDNLKFGKSPKQTLPGIGEHNDKALVYMKDVYKKQTGSTDKRVASKKKSGNGKCIRCSAKTEENGYGGYYLLCYDCSKLAPKCECKECSKKVTWNPREKSWYKYCWNHKSKN